MLIPKNMKNTSAETENNLKKKSKLKEVN